MNRNLRLRYRAPTPNRRPSTPLLCFAVDFFFRRRFVSVGCRGARPLGSVSSVHGQRDCLGTRNRYSGASILWNEFRSRCPPRVYRGNGLIQATGGRCSGSRTPVEGRARECGEGRRWRACTRGTINWEGCGLVAATAGDGGCDCGTYTQTCHDRRRTEEVRIGESRPGRQHRRGMHVGQVRRSLPLFLSPQHCRCVACSGGLSRTVSSGPRLSRRRAACDHRLTSTEIGSQGSPEAPCGRTDGQRFMANVVM